MKSGTQRWALLILGLGIITGSLVSFKASHVTGPGYAIAGVPAPGPGQKKVVLKNLGMT